MQLRMRWLLSTMVGSGMVWPNQVANCKTQHSKLEAAHANHTCLFKRWLPVKRAGNANFSRAGARHSCGAPQRLAAIQPAPPPPHASPRFSSPSAGGGGWLMPAWASDQGKSCPVCRLAFAGSQI